MASFDHPAYDEQFFKDVHDPTAQVEGTVFQYCTFENCHLAESLWHQCRFENCTFTGSDLSLVKLPKSRFKETRFKDCRLVGGNWCDADWERGSLLSPQ
ncbi:MAG: pentapeptide repeat-containing protein [Chloroflexota bacterium]|jgi:uncharacterized protein YjbI with pentapeptide repeats|nr:pentapeptide repeat-containing protein [Chloroflexota bacterium]